MGRIRNDKTKEYLLEYRELSNGVFRWIEHVGWLVTQFMGQYTFLSPISPYPVVFTNNCIYFGRDHKRCMFVKDKLNSEIVFSSDDEVMKQIWQRTYDKTHKANKKITNNRAHGPSTQVKPVRPI